jgi:DNA repair protein RecN (Recombination protein N)
LNLLDLYAGLVPPWPVLAAFRQYRKLETDLQALESQAQANKRNSITTASC